MPAILPVPSLHAPPPVSRVGSAWHWSGQPSLDAGREAARAARAFLASQGLDEDDLAAWELILTEAANNIILHGQPAAEALPFSIDLAVFPDRTTARVTDHTPGFDWPDDVSLPDPAAESGRGLFLIEALTSALSYHRSAAGNILCLERKAPASPPPCAAVAKLEQTLDAMTGELGACYESLSAIFRFTAEARQSGSLEDFATRLLQHLVTVTGADSGMLRVVSGSDLATIAVHGCDAPPACPQDASPLPLEAAAVSSRQDQWIEPTPHGTNCEEARPQAGLVHPFYHEDQLMGVLSVGRHHTDQPLNAVEVNIVHTFSEFFAQQVLSRRHAEAAIQASIAHREIELAAAIQHSLLPRRFPQLPGLSLAGHCESAMTVGGDFYDVIPWDNHGFFFVVADVMGKGVGASMMAAVTRSIFRSLNQLFQTPARAMERAARLLFDDLDRLEMFVTVAVGVIDIHRGIVRIANAGHCPVLVALPDGSVIGVEPSMPPLGLEKTPSCSEQEVSLSAGAKILAYSDGLVDPRDQRSPFTHPSEVSAWFATTARDSTSAESLKTKLLHRIGSSPSAGPSPSQADDQTFLIICCDPPATPS